MSQFADLVRFRATAGSTTDWVVSSAIGGCQLPSAANVQNGINYKFYAVSDDLTQWEVSTGAYNSGTTTFPRTTVLYNSSGTGTAAGQSGAGTKINFTLAPQVSVVALFEDLVLADATIGEIESWPTSACPLNRLKADGSSYNRTTYPALFAILVKSGTPVFTNGSANITMTAHGLSINDPIKLFTTGALPTGFTAGTHGLPTVGTNYFVKTVIDANTVTLAATAGGTAITAGSAGSGTQTYVSAPAGDGDGSTTFTVPDYRGGFLRSLDNGAGVDANRTVGSLQLDAFQGHFHSFSDTVNQYVWLRTTTPFQSFTTGGSAGTDRSTLGVSGPITDGTNGTPRTAAETRPRNIAVLTTIRYAP